MAKTQVRGAQVLDASIQRDDLDAATAGQAVVKKIIAGSGINIGSTGVDAGTGDVTINRDDFGIVSSILLTPGSATFPDGSSGNLAAGLSRRQGTESNPKKHFLTLDFDGSGSVEYVWWSFILPYDYVAAGGAKLQITWMANATANAVKFQARVGAIGPGDSDTPLEHAQAAAASVTSNVNATEARRMTRDHIDLTMDSAVANDHIFLALFRDSADAADTCTVDAEVLGCEFQYSTA